MTEKELKQLLGYIGVVRECLNMNHWEVQLHRDPCSNLGAWAETWQSENHRTINIKADPKLLEQSPEIIRNTVIHELVHAQHQDVNLLWEGCTLNNDDIAVSQSKSWDADFRMHMERFVSWVADRIEDSVPFFSLTARYKLDKSLSIHGPENSSPSD